MTTTTAILPTTNHTFRAPTGDLTVRSTLIDGEPWFVGADLLAFLYGGAAGQGHRYDKLAPEQLRKVPRKHLALPEGRPMMLVSESGLYKLIMRSDKTEARVFQHWVTAEVLPTIRKTGSYSLADAGREAIPLPMDIAEALATAVRPLEEKIASLAALIERLQAPAAEPEEFITASAALRRQLVCGMSSQAVGIRMAAYCRENAVATGSIPHSVYGEVKTYPASAFRRCFN